MSSQLQVSGEAKIRAIQGPVVANSGVITALNGGASQYVRGDGTLADFPTSTGGGSSVSYYLNSSVSQGTIGGVAYRQLSKTPISGAGTDIAISTTGYVASYLTDANDPALLEVPAGNFNCEFYFSVNNNTGNPFVYAEVYKYDGTTFTLLGTSVGVPEYITEGTVINPYYFAVPVATSVLTVTDRIAIRIYVNVDGRTVTLHTENNHLCQVVTTFSKGLISLNNLTRQNQFFGTGTSGTDFAISSSTATHTFNLPVASATNTGKLSSTDWSTFNGKQPAGNYVTLDTTQTITAAKTFTENPIINGAGTNSAYTILQSAGTNKWRIGNNYAAGVNTFDIFAYDNTTTPLSINSNGAMTLTANVTTTGAQFVQNGFYLTNANGGALAGYTLMFGADDGIYFALRNLTGGARFIFPSAASYNYTFPAVAGTIALTSNLSDYLPLAGGTLTGALSGTSASFSSTTASSTTTNGALVVAGGIGIGGDANIAGTTIFGVSASGNSKFYIYGGFSAGLNLLQNYSGSAYTTEEHRASDYIYKIGTTTALTIPSTGAATFSSSVTATQLSVNTTNATGKVNIQGPNDSGLLYLFNSSANARFMFNNYFGFGIDAMIIQEFNSSNAFVRDIISFASGGNVGIGTNSPSEKLHISSSASSTEIRIENSTTSAYIRSQTDNLNFYFNGAERMRITSGGDLYLGATSGARGSTATRALFKMGSSQEYLELQAVNTSSNTGLLFSDGASGNYGLIQYNSSDEMDFYTANTRQMRITSGGVVLINTTTITANNYPLHISGLGGIYLRASNSGDAAYLSHGGTGYHYYAINNSGTNTFYVANNGDVRNANNSYGQISDISLKKDIVPATAKLNDLMKVNIVNFKFINDDTNTKQIGVIAQELEEIFPNMISEETPIGGDKTIKSVKYSVFVPMLVKAIQEQTQIIKDLEARIVSLESK